MGHPQICLCLYGWALADHSYNSVSTAVLHYDCTDTLMCTACTFLGQKGILIHTLVTRKKTSILSQSVTLPYIDNDGGLKTENHGQIVFCSNISMLFAFVFSYHCTLPFHTSCSNCKYFKIIIYFT